MVMPDANYWYWINKGNQWFEIIINNNEDPEKILELVVDSANEIAGLEYGNPEELAKSVAYAKDVLWVWHNIFKRLGLDAGADKVDRNISIGYISEQMTNEDIPYTPPEDPLPTKEELYRRLIESTKKEKRGRR